MAGARIGVALLGLGTVGTEVCRLLLAHRDDIERRTGLRCEVVGAAVARAERPRPIRPAWVTTDAWALLGSPEVDVVVEVMGGLEPARSYVLRAIELGKPVVTANKQLIARHGAELFARAQDAGVDLGFEASVGASIPLIKPLRESLATDRIRAIEGILNGTTNYILTRMAEGAPYAAALAQAQARGFAEADPTDDVAGHDAAAKLAILASVAFGVRVGPDEVYREGIAAITPREIAYARDLGYVVKLLAIARDGEDGLDLRVHPTLLEPGHPLAVVADERNAVLVTGEASGRVVLSGPGAGGPPTAVAVLGDLIDVCRNLERGAGGRVALADGEPRPLRPIADLVTPYFVCLQVADRPGVFAKVAAVFGEEQVSLASIVQKSRGDVADVVLLTHEAKEAAMRRVVARLREMEVVDELGSVIRLDA